jgi:glycine cleavage system H protein
MALMRRSRAAPPDQSLPLLENGTPMLLVTVDKFTFRISEEVHYSREGVWVALSGKTAKLGLSDFAQQVNGDIAFANVLPAGTELSVGDEFGSIETIKVNVSLPSPVAGKVTEANAQLQDSPELINQDPYGKGWMTMVELLAPEEARSGLLDANSYRALVRDRAEAELKK